MPLTIALGGAELAGTRFAVSPLSGLQLLGGRGRQESNLRWVRWATDELAQRSLELSRTWPLIVNDRPSWPQFLVPAPAGVGTTIDQDLAAMQQTTARQVRTSLTRVFGDNLPDAAATLAAYPAAGLRAIAQELREATTGSSHRIGRGSGRSLTPTSLIAPSNWPLAGGGGCSRPCTMICSGKIGV